VIGENAEAVRLSQALLARGLLVPAIRTPTVPAGTARLRITLSAAHGADDVAQLIGRCMRSPKPVLALVHGWGMNARVFDALSDLLADDFDVHALDLRVTAARCAGGKHPANLG